MVSLIEASQHALVAALLTAGLGVLAGRLAMRRGLLQLRYERRRCASCGRFLDRVTCTRCRR